MIIGLLRLYYGLTARGIENLPAGGGYILAVNHQSFLDPFIVGAACPHTINFMARHTLWNSAFFRFGDWLLRVSIPLRRGTADRTALREAMCRLEQGRVILMFPEATRTVTGALGPVKKGPAFLAERCGAPVVPVIIKGAFAIWPKGRSRPSLAPRPFNRLAVRFGEPIYPADYAHLASHERLEAMTRMLDFRMHELFNDDR
ncbi:MAG: lysophospholipid acyltransferase family protein [Planctomycetota bacterium]